MVIDDDLINYYFSLNNRITKAKDRVTRMRYEFFQQTMASYCTSDDEKMYTQGFPVEKKVISLLDAEAMAAEQVELMAFKQRHFVRYLKQLTTADRCFLTHKYKWRQGGLNDRVERDCFEEIQEIEEAAGYQFAEYEPHIQVAEIEEVASENYGENLENSFEKMIARLGV